MEGQEFYNINNNKINNQSGSEDIEEMEEVVKRGPWTVEEDFTLINYVAHHGEGRWNSLARCAGLKRTGKSCRLRWLNYLRPDVRRGNITLEEQLLILELHSRWGNRWSKIAQHLPGRTDNEIKNYWRTRVQKHAKQLKCDVNSKQFKDAMRYLWMPRLVERIQAANNNSNNHQLLLSSSSTIVNPAADHHHMNSGSGSGSTSTHQIVPAGIQPYAPEYSSDSFGTVVSDLTESYNDYTTVIDNNNNYNYPVNHHHDHQQSLSNSTTTGNYFNPVQDGSGYMEQNSQWPVMDGGDLPDDFWDVVDDVWCLRNQFNINNIV